MTRSKTVRTNASSAHSVCEDEGVHACIVCSRLLAIGRRVVISSRAA